MLSLDVVNIERVDARWEAATEKSHRPRGTTVEIDETGRIAIVELTGDPHLAGAGYKALNVIDDDDDEDLDAAAAWKPRCEFPRSEP